MIDIIQIFKAKGVYDKANYNAENRKLFDDAAQSIKSENGYLDNTTLFLPDDFIESQEIKSPKLILLYDYVGDSINQSFSDSISLLSFRDTHIPRPFDIFKISKSENDSFELFIDYHTHATQIGIPARENHKICELRKNEPVRYKINGKSDFTFTGRKQRTFYEFDYLIEWIGTADNIDFKTQEEINTIKELPLADYKLIDERKILH